jgi:peptidoglycan hydrolase-like protein with peptidoglycan-binding domain
VKKLIIAIAAAALSGGAILPAAAQSATPNAVANLDMSATPDLDRGGVRAVQNSLRAKGFDPGRIDGVVGPLTREAIKAFQSRYGMKPTGAVDNQLLFALGHADLALAGAR